MLQNKRVERTFKCFRACQEKRNVSPSLKKQRETFFSALRGRDGAASLGVLVPRLQQWNNGGTVSAAAVEMNVMVKNRGTKILWNIIWESKVVERRRSVWRRARNRKKNWTGGFWLTYRFFGPEECFCVAEGETWTTSPRSTAVRKIHTQVQRFNVGPALINSFKCVTAVATATTWRLDFTFSFLSYS